MLDQEVIDSLQENEILFENIGKEFEKDLTFGERLSDKIASFGGSWTFIILFFTVLLIWIGEHKNFLVCLSSKKFA